MSVRNEDKNKVVRQVSALRLPAYNSVKLSDARPSETIAREPDSADDPLK